MKNQMPISIVVPALNEELTIGNVLSSVSHLSDDVIVIDGQSSDRTVAIAREYGVRIFVDDGKGKGNEVGRGCRKRGGECR